MTVRHEEPIARASSLLAMASVIVSAFGWNLIVGYAPRLQLTLVGAVFLFVATLGWWWAERRAPGAIAAWIGSMFALSVVALWLSDLNVMIVIMPVIGMAVLYGSMRWGIALTALYLVLFALYHASLGVDALEIYARSTGFIPGAVFVVVAAMMIVRERETRQQLRSYAAQVEELATTRERNRIAREIHDSVGHYLTVVNVQIEAARATLASDPAASKECLVRAQEFAREGLGELRRSVSILRTSAVEQRPFGVALAGLVNECKSAGLDTSLEVLGTPRTLPPSVEFTLFRAAQEALTNVVRHAHATQARCMLRYDEGEVMLVVSDNGVGAIEANGGFGLVGVRERVQLVGGSATVRTTPGQGFTLEVRAPT